MSSEPLKKECDYGERCYRKNPSHFEDYQHPHLNDLLKCPHDENGIAILPTNLKLKISRETLHEQLAILRNLLNSNPNSPISTTDAHSQSSSAMQDSPKALQTPSCSRKRQNENGGEFQGNKKKTELKLVNTKPLSSRSGNSNKTQRIPICDSTSALSSKKHRKKMQQARNIDEAMEFFQEVKKRSQGDICEKHRAAAPYYFFLTSVTDSKVTHRELLSLQLFDILDPSLGDLESSLQMNFVVEFGWLMAQYNVANQRRKPITLIYGEMDVDNLQFPNLIAVKVKPPSPFGSHHTKMCVLSYTDGSVRVCVHTANLVESDWDNRVQGVWLSPLCPALPLGADSAAGEAPTNFKRDLIQYLSTYRLPDLQPWIGKLQRADFSQINVFFVASTPGSHKGVDCERWGHSKLGSLLKQHVSITPKQGCSPTSWQIIAQCSSIGSLGPQPTSWLCGEIKQTMSRGIGQSLQSPPPLKLVYPSFKNVEASYDGLLGGGCLPYSRKTHDKQSWLQQYLYQWKCDTRHRTQAVPHIKTYTRVSPDFSQIAWFHLTSANMSKAAWGGLTKAGANSILSYEAGVLFLPKFVLGPTENTFRINEEAPGSSPVFPMPYDLPLTQYSSEDLPWFFENLSL